MKADSFKDSIGLNSTKLGCFNATSKATILDKDNQILGFCNDTPNNVAYAFKMFKTAVKINGQFKTFTKDTDIKNRMKWIMQDEIYHKQFITLP